MHISAFCAYRKRSLSCGAWPRASPTRPERRPLRYSDARRAPLRPCRSGAAPRGHRRRLALSHRRPQHHRGVPQLAAGARGVLPSGSASKSGCGAPAGAPRPPVALARRDAPPASRQSPQPTAWHQPHCGAAPPGEVLRGRRRPQRAAVALPWLPPGAARSPRMRAGRSESCPPYSWAASGLCTAPATPDAPTAPSEAPLPDA